MAVLRQSVVDLMSRALGWNPKRLCVQVTPEGTWFLFGPGAETPKIPDDRKLVAVMEALPTAELVWADRRSLGVLVPIDAVGDVGLPFDGSVVAIGDADGITEVGFLGIHLTKKGAQAARDRKDQRQDERQGRQDQRQDERQGRKAQSGRRARIDQRQTARQGRKLVRVGRRQNRRDENSGRRNDRKDYRVEQRQERTWSRQEADGRLYGRLPEAPESLPMPMPSTAFYPDTVIQPGVPQLTPDLSEYWGYDAGSSAAFDGYQDPYEEYAAADPYYDPYYAEAEPIYEPAFEEYYTDEYYADEGGWY